MKRAKNIYIRTLKYNNVMNKQTNRHLWINIRIYCAGTIGRGFLAHQYTGRIETVVL